MNIQETRRFGFGSTCSLLFFHCSRDEEARCQGHTCCLKGCQGRQRKGCCKRKLSNRAKFCETCGQIRQDGPRHKFSFPKHVLRPLTPEEKEEFPHQEEDAGAYRLDLGKHKMKSLSWLQEKVPSCIAWLVRERVYDLRPKLKDALISEGLFPESLLNLQDEKERCKIALEVIQSWHASQDDKDVNKQFDPAVRSTVEGAPQNADAVSDVLKTGKQTEKKRIHLKYMHPSQQTVAYAQKQRHALVERKHSGQELVRLSALDFTKVMLEHGLFEDLTGKPCQKPDCSTVSSGFGAEGGSVLGSLSASSAGQIPGSDITLKDCCYRCLKCRDRVAVTHGTVYFPPTAGGAYGPTHPDKDVF